MNPTRAGRPWSAAEDETIRASYGDRPGPDLAAELGRPLCSLYKRARQLGVSSPAPPGMTPGRREALTRLHALEWSDPEIAREVGVSIRTIRLWRVRLGLPSNTGTARDRRRRAAQLRDRAAALGLESNGEARRASLDALAIGAGWPAGINPAEVRVLDLLHERGPMTRRQICEALGVPWRGDGRELRCSSPRHQSRLSRLIHLGLVCIPATTPNPSGTGRPCKVYSLTLNAVKETPP